MYGDAKTQKHLGELLNAVQGTQTYQLHEFVNEATPTGIFVCKENIVHICKYRTQFYIVLNVFYILYMQI